MSDVHMPDPVVGQKALVPLNPLLHISYRSMIHESQLRGSLAPGDDSESDIVKREKLSS